ncbi:MAG: prolyl oligopeptidase family serine peptidase [Saprospiraceae bacterium]|nr:prolyl oligopeptidase family serine peptidase [Saprospiraceae bacterium]
MKVIKQLLPGVLLLLVLVLGSVYWYQRDTGDCRQRIDYSNVDLYEDLDRDTLLSPLQEEEYQHVLNDWSNFDLGSDSSHIHQRLKVSTHRELIIMSHDKEGQRHYGAVYLPQQFDSTQQYPLMLWANGLNQKDPTVYVTKNALIDELLQGLPNYFVVIPSYRGQALQTYYTRYCSDGFFGDAFDGATDDALRLLHWTQENFPAVDTQRLALFGVSRGGTVGLLAAARHPSLNCVVAQSGPTNFLLPIVSRRYGKQYRYQFLSREAPLSILREKIIKSSPLFFVDSYPGDLLLIYGKKDWVVPISNGENVAERLSGKSNFEYVKLEGGHSAAYTQQSIRWIKEHNGKSF